MTEDYPRSRGEHKPVYYEQVVDVFTSAINAAITRIARLETEIATSNTTSVQNDTPQS